MSIDFNNLLNVNADNVEKPKPIPVGTYTFVVKANQGGSAYKFREVNDQGVLDYYAFPIAADEDVDEEMLADTPQWRDRPLRLTFWLSPDDMWKLTDFMEMCGLSLAGKSLKELVPEVAGCQFKGHVSHREYKGDFIANIDSTAPAE